MKNMNRLALILIPTLLYTACPQVTVYQHGPSGGAYREYPVSIEIPDGDLSTGVEVFEAEVSVYRMNNRTDTSLRLDKTYNLVIQEAYGERITRIDYTDGRPAAYRSMISIGDNVVLFNPETEEISHKINIDQPQNPAYRLLSSQNYLSKINLSLIRQEAMRIALDIQTDNASTLTMAMPPEMAQLTHGDRRISSKISFDVKDEVLASTETVTMTAGGAMVTVTVTPRYEKVNGVPVKIGQTTVTQVDMPHIPDAEPYEGVIYNSPDDIPTISNTEYESLMQQGLIHEKTGLVFGDPSDLSYVETEVELYNTVKVNHAPAMAYKLPSWLKAVVSFLCPPLGTVIAVAETIEGLIKGNQPSNTPAQPVPNGHNGTEGTPAPVEPSATPLNGEELLAKVRSAQINGLHYYYFDGFGFEHYKASTQGITNIIQDEYRAISRGGKYKNRDTGKITEIAKSSGPYAIVGHSEGGLRSLGYATYLEREQPAEFKKLKGVVTISGANKGVKAFEGGIDVFKYKVYSDIDAFVNGLNSLNVLNIKPAYADLYQEEYSTAALVNYTLQNPMVRFLLNLFHDPLSNYIAPTLATTNYDTVAELRDLVPFSAFANTYVADAKVEIKKRVTGSVEKLKIFPFPYIVNENVYEYYSVYYDEQIQFNKNLPVAYIIGTDSNIRGMIGDSEPGLLKVIDGLAGAFEFAEGYYTAINYLSLGLADLFTDTLRSRKDARRAKEMFKDFNGTVHRLLGSKENDCLLARESMYYKSGNTLGKTYVAANHAKVAEHEDTKRAIGVYLAEMLK